MPKPRIPGAPANRTDWKPPGERPDQFAQRKVVMDALREHEVIRFDNKHSMRKYHETLAQLEKEGLITMEMVETGEQSTELHVKLATKRR